MRRWWRSLVRGLVHGWRHGRALATGGWCGVCLARAALRELAACPDCRAVVPHMHSLRSSALDDGASEKT